MQGNVISRSFRTALKLAAACDADLLCKALLTPPISAAAAAAAAAGGKGTASKHSPQLSSSGSSPPIPLSTCVRELVRVGFRQPLANEASFPQEAKSARTKTTRKSCQLANDKKNMNANNHKASAQRAMLKAKAREASPVEMATAFFAIRWLQQAVDLGTELRRVKRAEDAKLRAKESSSNANNARHGRIPHQPPFPSRLMPLYLSPTETIAIGGDTGAETISSSNTAAALHRTSVLYAHPSQLGDEAYRGVFACAGDGWQAAVDGAGEIAKSEKLRAKCQKKHRDAKSSSQFPIIQLNHRTEGCVADLFDAMPQLLVPGGGPAGEGGSNVSPSSVAFGNAPNTAASGGHRNVLGQLPVYLGGPHQSPHGPYVVHSNHTIAYLLAARRCARTASTIAARPFYVEAFADIMSLPLRIVSTLNSNNTRVVMNHFKGMSSLPRGPYMHDVSGRSAPIALFGMASALMTPAAAAAVAAGRLPAPRLPKDHDDWAEGLKGCGLGELGYAANLTPQRRAKMRNARLSVWETGSGIPATTTKTAASNDVAMLPRANVGRRGVKPTMKNKAATSVTKAVQ